MTAPSNISEYTGRRKGKWGTYDRRVVLEREGRDVACARDEDERAGLEVEVEVDRFVAVCLCS